MWWKKGKNWVNWEKMKKNVNIAKTKKQNKKSVHNRISCVRVGRGSDFNSLTDQLKNRPTDRPTDRPRECMFVTEK